MAERKRRPPSNKIKPGTPHPTKAHTVRGFDGRWVTRKSFNAAKKARGLAKKGGSLVKRTSSAVTKATKGAMTKASKAGDLLKINKGDKGLIRGIKDTYQFGKDTRKSADALYKAGKITREVHDKLVKGAKDFFGGVKEAGKATRRAYEKTKPGGKIVKTKGSKLSKYTKPPSKIVKSPGGKIVKNPGGKVVKNPGGKVVKSSGGKLTTTRKPQYKVDAESKASKAKTTASRNARRDAAKMKQTRSSTGSQNVSKTWNPKTKKWVTKYGNKTTGQPINRVRQGLQEIDKRTPQAVKGLKKGGKTISKWAGKTGVVGKLAGRALTIKELGDQTADIVRGVGNVYRKSKNKPLLKRLNVGGIKFGTGDTDKLVDKQNKRLKETGSFKLQKKGKEQSNTEVSQVKGWNARNLAKKKAQSEKKLANIPAKEGNATVPGRDGKAYRVNPEFGKKTGSGNTTESDTPYWQSPRQKQEPTKKKRMHSIEKENRKIHGDKAVDTLKQKHKEWKIARKNGTLDAWRKKWKKK